MRRGSTDRFLTDVTGLVHVGANVGQERKLYAKLGLQVLWIEPIPEVFAALQSNLSGFPGQAALQALITDQDGAEYPFNVASNNGASSSILEFGQHRDIWPDVHFTNTITLKSLTLASLFRREGIDPTPYQALVMDTQGSELLVLKGAISMLGGFRYVKTEAADFESYAGCCQLSDIRAFMEKHGFIEHACQPFASRPEGGNYFNIVFKNGALVA